jgi:hypothetical protein
MHVLTLFSLCFAAIDVEVVDDAKVTVQFLQQKLQVCEGKPAATLLLYFILTALQRYHAPAASAAWGPIDLLAKLVLHGGYGALIPNFPRALSYTTDQLDDERAVANAICDWASIDVKQPGAFQPADYYPGLKMFIILHTVAVVCRDEPTKERGRALAVNWLARLDLEQFTLCEFIMLDVNLWVNIATWKAYPVAGAKFLGKLKTKTLWEMPRGYSPDRWQDWLGLVDKPVFPLADSAALNSIGPITYTGTALGVFDVFRLFLTGCVWYIKALVGSRLGRNNACHMIQWMRRMWSRAEELLPNDPQTKVTVQNRLDEIKAELGFSFWQERSAIRPPVKEGSSG